MQTASLKQMLWTAVMAALLLMSWTLLTPKARAADGATCELPLKKAKLCASLTWTKPAAKSEMPTAKDMGELDLRFTQKGKPVSKPLPYKVRTRLWMPDMDHGSQPTQTSADPQDPNLYHVKNVYFSMGGKWEIWVELYKGKKLIDKAKVEYTY